MEDRLVIELIERIARMEETESKNIFLNDEITKANKALEMYKGRYWGEGNTELAEELNRHMQEHCPKTAANTGSWYILDLLAELQKVTKLSPEYLLNCVEDEILEDEQRDTH